jgi:hypothetical protein
MNKKLLIDEHLYQVMAHLHVSPISHLLVPSYEKKNNCINY